MTACAKNMLTGARICTWQMSWGEMDQLSVTYTIEDQLAEKELLEIINDFLGKMNAGDRDIFVRRYWFFIVLH